MFLRLLLMKKVNVNGKPDASILGKLNTRNLLKGYFFLVIRVIIIIGILKLFNYYTGLNIRFYHLLIVFILYILIKKLFFRK